jgi:hypothetical protein
VEQPPTSLSPAQVAARKAIQDRIDQAKEIFPRPIRTTEDWDKAKKQELKWRFYNSTLLSKLFPQSRYVLDYAASVLPIHLPSDRQKAPSFEAPGSRLLESVQSQIVILESIMEQIELLHVEPIVDGTIADVVDRHEVEAHVAIAQRTPPPKEKARAPLIDSVTILGVRISVSLAGAQLKRVLHIPISSLDEE